MAQPEPQHKGLLWYIVDSIADPDFQEKYPSLEEAMEAYELSDAAQEAIRTRDLREVRTAVLEQAGGLVDMLPEVWHIWHMSGE